MKYNIFIKLGLVSILSLILVGCGETDKDTSSSLDEDVQKIVNWANGKGSAPSEADYNAAGVILNGKNVDDVNSYIKQLADPSKVDTVGEINSIVEELGVTILDSDGDGIFDAFDNTPHGNSEGNHAPEGKILNTISNVIVGTKVNLTTESNDSDGDALTYLWYFDKRPSDSLAVLSSTNTKNTSFTPDKVGEYQILFQVKDSETFDSDSITIKAESANSCTELTDFNLYEDTVFYANKCYKIERGLSLSGMTLTIEEGAKVIFGKGKGLNVDASSKILAQGTNSNPILFTTSADKTAGSWTGIYINKESKGNELSDVIIEYAKTAVTATNLKVRNCIIKNSEKYGINYAKGNVDIKNTLFKSNNIPLTIYADKIYQLDTSNSFVNNINNYIEVKYSTIEDSQTWKKQAVPYFMYGGVEVTKNSTLTIEKGVKIFNRFESINIEGTLKAIGTKSEPIIFTRDPKATREVDYWYGIRLFTNSSYADIAQNHELAFVQVDYAENGLIASGGEKAHFKFYDSNITNNKNYPLGLDFTKGYIDKFERVSLKNNGDGAHISAPTLKYIDSSSDFTGNEKDYILLDGGLQTGKHVWKKMSVPIYTGRFTIDDKAELTIKAGNHILAFSDFLVYGTLNVLGTANDRVLFTPAPYVEYDGSIKLHKWNGIFFWIREFSKNSKLSYVSISGTAPATNYYYDGVRVTGGAKFVGTQLIPLNTTVTIENSIFDDIAGYGIRVDCYSKVTQSNNTFKSIGKDNIYREECN